MSVGIIIDELFAAHQSPRHHPECPERLAAARRGLTSAGAEERGTALPIRQAERAELERVHAPDYLDLLDRAVRRQCGWLDGDTYYCEATYEATLAAAGAAADLVEAVVAGTVDRGLAAIRPPGHHAEADRGMGFCLVNNAAVAAAAARAGGVERVAILDWDVHHGNGTQNIFYDQAAVTYLSVHQYPFYPGTGSPDQVGSGAGRGHTINVGLPPGCGDGDYAAVFDEVLLPELVRAEPQLVILSAGFDAHVSDPLASMSVSSAGFEALARRLVRECDRIAGGRVVAVLEGGYDLDALADCVGSLFSVLCEPVGAVGEPAGVAPAVACPGAVAAIDRTRAALAAAREEPS